MSILSSNRLDENQIFHSISNFLSKVQVICFFVPTVAIKPKEFPLNVFLPTSSAMSSVLPVSICSNKIPNGRNVSPRIRIIAS